MSEKRSKVTIPYLLERKRSGSKISMLTAYDFSMASIMDEAGVDMVLVGDSLGMVVLGYESTVPVTMDEMLHHCKAVRRGIKHAFLVGDMPFMSYQISKEEALHNAGRFIKEAGCDAVKIEGGVEIADTAAFLVKMGVPVVGHIGLTPQTATSLGGFKVQGKDIESARKLLESARALDGAGICSLVIECVPDKVAEKITESISAPTIGIGAGSGCDGQVLVSNDLLGLFRKFTPKFVKKYADLFPLIDEAVKNYIKEVSEGTFPGEEHTFVMKEDLSDLS